MRLTASGFCSSWLSFETTNRKVSNHSRRPKPSQKKLFVWKQWKMLRRNRFGFRMRRRSLSGRLFQFLVVLTVVSLFIYLILYSTNFSKDFYGPDFQWLKTRNVSNKSKEVFVLVKQTKVDQSRSKQTKVD